MISVLIAVIMIFTPFQDIYAQKKRTIVLEEMKIEGTIQKPEVMTFVSRARFTYRTLELDVSFIDKVEKAIHIDDAF